MTKQSNISYIQWYSHILLTLEITYRTYSEKHVFKHHYCYCFLKASRANHLVAKHILGLFFFLTHLPPLSLTFAQFWAIFVRNAPNILESRHESARRSSQYYSLNIRFDYFLESEAYFCNSDVGVFENGNDNCLFF